MRGWSVVTGAESWTPQLSAPRAAAVAALMPPAPAADATAPSPLMPPQQHSAVVSTGGAGRQAGNGRAPTAGFGKPVASLLSFLLPRYRTLILLRRLPHPARRGSPAGSLPVPRDLTSAGSGRVPSVAAAGSLSFLDQHLQVGRLGRRAGESGLHPDSCTLPLPLCTAFGTLMSPLSPPIAEPGPGPVCWRRPCCCRRCPWGGRRGAQQWALGQRPPGPCCHEEGRCEHQTSQCLPCFQAWWKGREACALAQPFVCVLTPPPLLPPPARPAATTAPGSASAAAAAGGAYQLRTRSSSLRQAWVEAEVEEEEEEEGEGATEGATADLDSELSEDDSEGGWEDWVGG